MVIIVHIVLLLASPGLLYWDEEGTDELKVKYKILWVNGGGQKILQNLSYL